MCVPFIIIVEPTHFKCDVIHVIKRILYPYIISNVHCVQKRQVKENNALSFYHSLRRWTCRFIMGFNDGHQTR